MSERKWSEWLEEQTEVDQMVVIHGVIQRLIELEEIRFRQTSDDPDDGPECLYWVSCGEDLRVPF